MAYIETSIPPMKVFVRRSFLNGNIDDKSYEQAVLISVRCLEGSAALFQILTETGRMRDKLPLSAFCWKIPDSEDVWEKYPFHSLQLWDCFSRDFSIVQLSYVYNCRTTILMKDRSQLEGQYQWTIQWAGNNNLGGADITLAEDGSEHKCHHFIRLDNGLFALQPNNRILKWNEPSFCTKPIGKDEAPWVVNEAEYCCEQHEKWTTEDSRSYFYELAKKMEEEGPLPEIPETVSFVSFERDISKPEELKEAAGKDAAADFAWFPCEYEYCMAKYEEEKALLKAKTESDSLGEPKEIKELTDRATAQTTVASTEAVGIATAILKPGVWMDRSGQIVNPQQIPTQF
jgi:hypothetical protein